MSLWQVTVSTIAQENTNLGMGYGGIVDGRPMRFQATAIPEPGSLPLVCAAAVDA